MGTHGGAETVRSRARARGACMCGTHGDNLLTLARRPVGVQYKVLQSGRESNDPPSLTDKVVCHYKGASLVSTVSATPHRRCAGTLIDGTEFDSSYKRGRPATFGVTQVIKGE